MTTNNKIQEAIKMIETHDWYWRMAEEFTRHYNNAKASMKTFVTFVNTIEDKAVREQLRALWVLYFDNANAAINGKEYNGFDIKKAEILKALAC